MVLHRMVTFLKICVWGYRALMTYQLGAHITLAEKGPTHEDVHGCQ